MPSLSSPNPKVLSLTVIITAGVVQHEIRGFPESSNLPGFVGSTNAAAGWMIFVVVIAMLYEAVFIMQRFLNLGIINSHIKIAILVVSECCGDGVVCL